MAASADAVAAAGVAPFYNAPAVDAADGAAFDAAVDLDAAAVDLDDALDQFEGADGDE